MPFPNVVPALAAALAARDYAEPTPVQSAVLAEASTERDLLVSAQTGSGKTVAFGLAMAPTLLGPDERFGAPGRPLALVIAPTRELAIQVRSELTWLYSQTGARIASCVGGMDPRAEARALQAGCHIVVGTPGRLRDHLERGRLDLSDIRAAVLDEADEMLDLGFREDLETLLDATPVERRTLLFSATIPKEIATLAARYQRDGLRIAVGGGREAHGDIDYRAVLVAAHDTERAVVNVLRYYEVQAALIFCATRDATRRLHGRLLERGFAAVALSGELSQHERTGALQALRDGRSRVCVATDVAARGLDLPRLDLVIHADLPTNKETMLHRSGRTGRAGRKGVSVLLVPHARRRRAELLFHSAAVDAGWSDPPSAELIAARDEERLLADKLLTDPPAEEDAGAAAQLLARFSPEQLAASLARLWRSGRPAPEDGFEPSPEPRRPANPPPGGPANDGAWFRIALGRRSNADPRWLIPIICRVGRITKNEIGTIRVFDRETKFQIAPAAAAGFADAIREASEAEPRIEPALPPAPSRPGPRRRNPPR